MAKRLTDKKKKQIIADYIELGSISASANKNKVSRETVRRTIRANPNVTEIATEKKAQNTIDMITFLDSRKDKAQQFVDLCFAALLTPEKMSGAQLSQINTAMGTVIDKFTEVTWHSHIYPRFVLYPFA